MTWLRWSRGWRDNRLTILIGNMAMSWLKGSSMGLGFQEMNVFSRRGDREPQPNWMNWNAGEGRNRVLIFAEKC